MSMMPEPENTTNTKINHFLKRYKKAQGVADLWMALHQACYFYAIPNRNKFWRPQEQQGEMRGARVYDTTAIEGAKTFVSKIHTAMTPPQTQWGFLSLSDEFDGSDEEAVQAQRELDAYMTKLFKYIHASNFDVVINECYFDLAVGTSCLVVNQYNDKQPLLFTSVPMDKLAIEEAMTGRIESWYRNWENVKINEITKRWPKGKLSARMIQDADADSSATVRMVYEGVMYEPKNEDAPYTYMVCSDDHEIYTEKFEINPGIVWRFQKTNNDVFGRGPVMDALPSIISLNELARIELASANLNVFRPFMAFSDAVFNPHTFKMQPMGIIPIAPIGAQGQVPLIPLPETANPQFAQITIADLRMQINRLLFAESPVPDTGSKQPESATAIMTATQELAKKIGPLFSRLQQEFLWPVIDRCMYILDKMGLLPLPSVKKKYVQFVYRSPLALAEGQQQIARFTQFYQLLQGIAGPEFAQIFVNPSMYPWVIADLMQIDSRFLNDPDMVTQTAQDLQNKMSEANEMAQAQGEQGAQMQTPTEGAM
jgi:hypothetical protein